MTKKHKEHDKPKEDAVKETVKALKKGELEFEEVQKQEEEKNDELGLNLPFPKATIVNKLRGNLDKGKQIKGPVKNEMNLWLGKMVERIAKKMNSHPYTYVDSAMFREAIETYENVQDIESERERIIKQLESVKAACDVLINEVDRKFRL